MSKRSSRFRNRPARFSSGARVERAPRVAAPAEKPVELAQQYAYVIGDLTRVGIIAVVLVGIMILLRIFVIK